MSYLSTTVVILYYISSIWTLNSYKIITFINYSLTMNRMNGSKCVVFYLLLKIRPLLFHKVVYPFCYYLYLLIVQTRFFSPGNSHFLAFLDDIKLFLHVNSINDCNLLKNNLNRFVSWGETLNSSFNIFKCCSIPESKTHDFFLLH